MDANAKTWPAFHAGEVMLQERAGIAERMAEVGPRVVRRHMPDQHREFFAQLPYLIVGGLDRRARPWASILCGAPGFVQSPNDTQLDVAAGPGADDPLAGCLVPGAPVGLLGLEAPTRRRNRANGVVAESTPDATSVHILESFGNCPKYIHARGTAPAVLGAPMPAEPFTRLSVRARAVIAQADTFFIATAHPDALARPGHGVDVSHRGGKPGFVRIDRPDSGEDVLVVPDFVGNFFFNTLGNIMLNPRVGLLFIDHAGQDLVQLAGHADVVLEGPELASFAGARRLLRIRIDEGVLRHNVLPLRWTDGERSPFLADTGRW